MRLDGYKFQYSPNHSERGNFRVEWVIIHYTAAGKASGSIDWLCNYQSAASAHFVIDRNGETTQLVELDKAAWHAGTSEAMYDGQNHRGVNRFSIGIELANYGQIHRGSNAWWVELGDNVYKYSGLEPEAALLISGRGLNVPGFWEPYTNEQYAALDELLLKIKNAGYPVKLLGHADISTPVGRKLDPGPLFDFSRYDYRGTMSRD